MSTTVPAFAKTTRPTLSGAVPRERLFRMLDDARASSAIWITGPPGSGKTTLAASYLALRKPASLWYQLDASDADVASFFYHLGLATAEHGKRRPARLHPLTPQQRAGLPAFTRRYFQTLYRGLGASFAIVFDGYQELTPQAALHDVMALALAEVPPGGSIIVISRTDPPASMVRLRANRAMEVIGWRELKLTQEESDAIALRRRRGLTQPALAELYDRTQGWAAGLILMLEQTPASDSPAAPADLSTPQLVFDYLAGEIFQKTDMRTQELLLTTAFLPQMTVDMARSVSGQENAGERLAHLYRNNYFMTVKQAQPQPVYEYHPLLREFVVARATATLAKERRQQLQRASADLLEAHGLVAEAAQLMRATGDWTRIESLIRRHARVMMDSGRSETLAQWVEWLPKDVQAQNPWTLYWLAVARMHASPRESRLLHERAYDLFLGQPEPDLRGLVFSCSGAMDAILYELDDFSLLDRWIAIMDRLLRDHPDLVSGAAEARITCSLFTSMVVRQTHHPEIEHWGDRAYRASIGQPDVNVRMSVEPRVALGIAWGGHFPKAWAIIEGVRKLAKQHDLPPLSLTMGKLVEATYFMLTANGAACLQAAREGLEIERSEGVVVLSYQLIAYGTGGALATDDLAAAEAILSQSGTLPGTPARFDLCLHHLFSTWLAWRRNDLVHAFQQQKLAVKMAVEVGCPVFEVLCRVASAHVQYQGGDYRAAMANFQQVYDIARRIRNHLLEYTGLMAYAYVALHSGRRPRSGLWSLRRALAVGNPRNYTAFLLWRPDHLAHLCSIALEHAIEPDFVHALIRSRSLVLDAASSASLDWPWPLRVQTLGQFRVLKNGTPIVFSGKAQRRPFDLLKALIAYGGREVSEERIIEALWPRIDGDSAHRSFNTTLHRLRKLLGEDGALVLSEGKLSLDGCTVWVDLWALDQLTAHVSEVLRPSSTPPAPPQVEALGARLLALYRGAFLGNEPEQGWIVPPRDRHRHRFVRAVCDMARVLRHAGCAPHAVDLLERAIEADGTAEPLYRDLIMCYSELGRQAEAADTYNRCARTLRIALDAAPSTETRALYDKLRASS